LGDTAKAEHYLRLDLATARYWSDKDPDDRDSHANLAHSLASLAFLLTRTCHFTDAESLFNQALHHYALAEMEEHPTMSARSTTLASSVPIRETSDARCCCKRRRPLCASGFWGKWVIRVELGPSRAIVEAVSSWRATLNRSAPVTGETDPAATIRRLVWTPLEPYLADATSVLISPDAALNRLPFAALPGREPGKYLLEELSLAVVPVAQQLPYVLAQPEPSGRLPREEPPSLLLLGAVDFDSEGPIEPSPISGGTGLASRSAPRSLVDVEQRKWVELAATAGEIATLEKRFRRAFDGAGITVLEEGEATESAFRAASSKHRYLHLATHAFFARPSEHDAVSSNCSRTVEPDRASPCNARGVLPPTRFMGSGGSDLWQDSLAAESDVPASSATGVTAIGQPCIRPPCPPVCFRAWCLPGLTDTQTLPGTTA